MALVLMLLSCGIAGAQTFGSDGKIPGAVKMPSAVMSVLAKQEQVVSCEAEATRKTSWFLTAKVDLNGDRYPDYVVRSNTACLTGPRAASWWIFRGGARGYEKVFDDSVLSVTINRKRRTGGFFDIQTETVMMNIIRNTWKFDGRKYELKSTKIIEPSR